MILDDEARENNAEMIWREVSGASPFRRRDVKDPYGLVCRFWDPRDAVSAHLRHKFSWATRQQMNEYDGTPPPPEELVCAVLRDFNQWLIGPSCFYDERLFAGVELTDEATGLLNGVLERVEEIRLNRILLEAACSPAIAHSNGFTQNLNSLERWAGFLLIGKAIRGEINGEAHFRPLDVALEAIAHLADGKAVWQPEKSKFLTFACLVMRSIVSHKLDKLDNTRTERIGQPPPRNDDDSPRDEDERLSDSGRGAKMFMADAEYVNIMELFYEGSPEREVLEVFNRGKGDERPGEIAAELGMSVREVKKCIANIMEMLTKLNYF
jgi:DNA-directed RNA polymerase specialized sigma24 family protein